MMSKIVKVFIVIAILAIFVGVCVNSPIGRDDQDIVIPKVVKVGGVVTFDCGGKKGSCILPVLNDGQLPPRIG